MSDAFLELLDATIRHLEDLKSGGERWVQADPQLLAGLSSRTRGVRRVEPEVVRTAITPPVEAPVSTSQNAPSAVASPQAASESAVDKAAAFAQLRERVLVCQQCPHLVRSRKNVVFGVGDINSPLMFVGEAPGADEDTQGEPFVGAAGQLLTRIIKTMGFTRETVYIANILKCRPDTPGQSFGNRKPSVAEMKTCLPYLLEQINLIQPRVVVALGGTAMEGLFGRAVAITRVRGSWQSFNDIPVMPTYHPSYLLRNQVLSVKREVWEDMLKVLEKLGMTITEKQQNYFKS